MRVEIFILQRSSFELNYARNACRLSDRNMTKIERFLSINTRGQYRDVRRLAVSIHQIPAIQRIEE
jgi:hypothetical protein